MGSAASSNNSSPHPLTHSTSRNSINSASASSDNSNKKIVPRNCINVHIDSETLNLTNFSNSGSPKGNLLGNLLETRNLKSSEILTEFTNLKSDERLTETRNVKSFERFSRLKSQLNLSPKKVEEYMNDFPVNEGNVTNTFEMESNLHRTRKFHSADELDGNIYLSTQPVFSFQDYKRECSCRCFNDDLNFTDSASTCSPNSLCPNHHFNTPIELEVASTSDECTTSQYFVVDTENYEKLAYDSKQSSRRQRGNSDEFSLTSELSGDKALERSSDVTTNYSVNSSNCGTLIVDLLETHDDINLLYCELCNMYFHNSELLENHQEYSKQHFIKVNENEINKAKTTQVEQR